jgi:outer membrane protein OmpA-like peptidoglycan-associated protein
MKLFVCIFLVVFLLLPGCAFFQKEPPPSVPIETIQETIAWARKDFESVVEQLQIQKKYQDDFQKARNSLMLAETSFQEELYDQAYFSALDSLDASQRILRRFYQETVVSSAQEAKTRIEAMTAEDPENPLQEFLPALTEILDYSEAIDDEQGDVDIVKVLADLETVTEIGNNAQKTMKQTLESDVSFASGEYELSDAGKQILAQHCQVIIAATQEFQQEYPDRTILIKIHVSGYTDEVDFREGTNLLKLLTEGMEEDEIPRTQPALRKFLNRRLSEFRADTIGEFLVQYILQEDPETVIERKSIGFGEGLPAGIDPPYPLVDPRRRICRIYTYILVR